MLGGLPAPSSYSQSDAARFLPQQVSSCATTVAAWHTQHLGIIALCFDIYSTAPGYVTHVYCQTIDHCFPPTLFIFNDLPLIASPMTVSPIQDMLERDRQNASSSVARERARAAAAERDAESASGEADARRRQLQHDLDNAHSEVNLPIFCLTRS